MKTMYALNIYMFADNGDPFLISWKGKDRSHNLGLFTHLYTRYITFGRQMVSVCCTLVVR